MEITLDLCVTSTCESVDASGSTCCLEMNDCTIEKLLALALELLCGCSRAEHLSQLTPYLPSLLALPRLCRSSQSADLLRRSSTPASRCSLQSLVCLAGHCMRVAELASGALAAAAAGGSASTTPASELQHQQQLQQQCSSLVAALVSFVGAPVILERLLAPLDALPLDALLLEDADAGARTPRARAVRADGGRRSSWRMWCTSSSARAQRAHCSRAARSPDSCGASSASTRHFRAPTSGWKCRLRVRLRHALTRSRATRTMRETDRATCDSCGAKSCGDAHTWRRGARVAASSARTSATYLFGTVGATRAQRRPLGQAHSVARSSRCEEQPEAFDAQPEGAGGAQERRRPRMNISLYKYFT